MEDLYHGCDVLDLVGKGKKAATNGLAPINTSRSMANMLAEAIDKKCDKIDKDVIKKAHSIADFRFVQVATPTVQCTEDFLEPLQF